VDLRFGHIADTHLGAAPYGVKEREDDFYGALDEALDAMEGERVDFIVHSGDIFDSPRPPGTALNRLARRLLRLRERGIGFYFVLGEHDISRLRETPSSLVYDVLGLARELRGEPVLRGDVELVGLPKRRRGEADKLREELRRIGAAQPRGRLRVLVLHQGIVEAHRFAGEISAQDLPPNFSYYAMGHLHDRFERAFDFLGGPLCYPGSIEFTQSEGIRPGQGEKGFYIVDASGGELHPQWVRLSGTRPHLYYELRYEDLKASVTRILSEISGMGRKPMVRVVVRGRGMRNEEIAAALRPLSGAALHYVWEKEEEGEPGRIVRERPEDLRSKMRELAAHALGSEELASFALDELLPHLREGDAGAAAEALYEAFRRGRFGLDSRGPRPQLPVARGHRARALGGRERLRGAERRREVVRHRRDNVRPLRRALQGEEREPREEGVRVGGGLRDLHRGAGPLHGHQGHRQGREAHARGAEEAGPRRPPPAGCRREEEGGGRGGLRPGRRHTGDGLQGAEPRLHSQAGGATLDPGAEAEGAQGADKQADRNRGPGQGLRARPRGRGRVRGEAQEGHWVLGGRDREARGGAR
jgi:DNA repair exonuclease SbcCD nuclease subunit